MTHKQQCSRYQTGLTPFSKFIRHSIVLTVTQYLITHGTQHSIDYTELKIYKKITSRSASNILQFLANDKLSLITALFYNYFTSSVVRLTDRRLLRLL